MLEHDQFSLSHKCFDIASFNQAIQTVYKGKLLVDVDSSSIRHSQPWHIERVRKQLSLLFGDEHKDGIVNVLDYDGLVDYINELPLKNAGIITKETL
jgi:hypothetical protein